MTTTELDGQTTDHADSALTLAQRLIDAGIPVVVVKPGDKPPSDWQTAKADRAALDRFRPGVDALAMVTGHGLDVVDVDTKGGKGGSVDNLPPFKSYGVTRTPSGGEHHLVPSSGLGKISPLVTDLGAVGDYCGGRMDGTGRMLAFLPGSHRTKYPQGGYVEEIPWDVGGALAAEPDADLVAALRKCGGSLDSPGGYIDRSEPRPAADGLHPYAGAVVSRELARLDDCGLLGWAGQPWDATTYEVACNLVEFANSGWSGYTLEAALTDLLEHAPTDERFGPGQHHAKWSSALNRVGDNGRRSPDAATDFAQIADRPATPVAPSRMVGGGAFILDAPSNVAAVWGDGTQVLWAEGEALTIVAPSGVGKTRLARDLVRARINGGGPVLGLPVTGGRRVLYLAMDRPRQIQRLLAGGLSDLDRELLDDRLTVWQGPPPEDVAKATDTLLKLAKRADADTIVVDSIKDAAIGLSDDAVGAGYNRARQTCIAAGIEVLELHHMTKYGPQASAPKALADVYGSTWITAGAGSVVLLWGKPGDPIVDFRHLKQPVDEVGPFKVRHDAYSVAIHHAADLVDMARAAGSDGLTAKAAAAVLFDNTKPSPAEVEKARRRLAELSRKGFLDQQDGDRAAASPACWTFTETFTRGSTP